MLRITVCLLGAILLLATLTGVGTMVQESRDEVSEVSMEKTAQTIDIMRRVLARSISRELTELYTSEDEGQEDGKEDKTVGSGGGAIGVGGGPGGVSWATTQIGSPFIYTTGSGYSNVGSITSNTRGFRVPGLGVIFPLDVSVPAKQVETTDEVEDEKADADDDWEQARNEASGRLSNAYTIYNKILGSKGEKLKQSVLVIEPKAVDAVIKAVVKSVASYGLKIEGLDNDDSIVVAMQLEGNRIISSSGETNRLFFTSTSSGSARQRVIIEIDCSVLGRYADGRIDLDAVRSRAKITSY